MMQRDENFESHHSCIPCPCSNRKPSEVENKSDSQEQLKVHCRSLLKIFILIVFCETSSMIPISVSFASRWGSYEGAKLQKRPIMRGHFRFSGLTMLNCSRLLNVCASMEESRPGNGLNKKLLSPGSLS